MKIGVLATALALLAGQASALSCLRPDPVETFQRLAAAPESYFVLYGTLSFDESALPGGMRMDQNAGMPDPVPGRFVGKGLSTSGFTIPYVTNVMVQATCAGPWCGSARSGGEAVYFVPSGPAPVSLQATPCGDMIFPDPSPAVLEMLTSCMQGGTCELVPLD
ncbi:MAG: hypothetical protein ACSHW1_08070 [Yoonia sp.]|uniref:hypothetical protein n=1 Tax=Yoonia sp. TaxID=2212373 RepID=UPI003EF41600